MPLGQKDQEQLKKLNEIVEEMRRLNSQPQGLSADDKAKLDTLGEAVAQVQLQLQKSMAPERLGEFDVTSGREAHRQLARIEGTYGPEHALDTLVRMQTRDPEIVASQEACDDALLIYKLLDIPPMQQKHFNRRMNELPYLKRTIATTTETAWIPTAFSSALHELIRLDLKVAALHSRITMPTEPYKLPIEGSDANSYMVPEQGEPDAELTVGNRIPNGMTPNAGALNLTLSSKKIGTRVVFSEELTEDSIIPVLPYLRNKVARSFAQAQEDITLNGDTTGTHMDTDANAAANDRRRAWIGYRKFARALSGTPTIISNSGSITVVTTADLRKLRATMGKYSVNPAELCWVTGPIGWHKMLSIAEVLTVDKYGPQATILSGELGRFDGIPIIVSEWVKENLNAFGVNDGVTTDRTLIHLVRRDAFVYGDRRQATLRNRFIIETEQLVLAGTQRLTMGAWFATAPVTGYLMNIKL